MPSPSVILDDSSKAVSISSPWKKVCFGRMNLIAICLTKT